MWWRIAAVIGCTLLLTVVQVSAQRNLSPFGKMGARPKAGSGGAIVGGCVGAIDLTKTCVIPALRGIP
jgi:hypothetical protein